MILCYKCKARVVNHLWIHNDRVYCGVGCQRGAKSMFEKTWRALEKIYTQPNP